MFFFAWVTFKTLLLCLQPEFFDDFFSWNDNSIICTCPFLYLTFLLCFKPFFLLYSLDNKSYLQIFKYIFKKYYFLILLYICFRPFFLLYSLDNKSYLYEWRLTSRPGPKTRWRHARWIWRPFWKRPNGIWVVSIFKPILVTFMCPLAEFQHKGNHRFFSYFKIEKIDITFEFKLKSKLSTLTSHSAYVATETKSNGVKIDGFLPPNFL